MLQDALTRVSIASPCTVGWDSMEGDDRTRFCWMCTQNVYNIEDLTRAEANKLLSGANGEVCIRVFKRPDGTILTKDCPVGLRQVRERVKAFSARACATVAVLISIVSLRTDIASALNAGTVAGATVAGATVGGGTVGSGTIGGAAPVESAQPALFTMFQPANPDLEPVSTDAFDPLVMAQRNARLRAESARTQGQPIPPQGGDAVIISGYNMGTAGTVRVNNLANLEALLNILANAVRFISVSVSAGIAWPQIVDRMRGFPGSSRRVLLAIALAAVGFGFPSFLNWLVMIARSAMPWQ